MLLCVDVVMVIDVSDFEVMRVVGSVASFGGMRRLMDLYLYVL